MRTRSASVTTLQGCGYSIGSNRQGLISRRPKSTNAHGSSHVRDLEKKQNSLGKEMCCGIVSMLSLACYNIEWGSFESLTRCVTRTVPSQAVRLLAFGQMRP